MIIISMCPDIKSGEHVVQNVRQALLSIIPVTQSLVIVVKMSNAE